MNQEGKCNRVQPRREREMFENAEEMGPKCTVFSNFITLSPLGSPSESNVGADLQLCIESNMYALQIDFRFLIGMIYFISCNYH